MASRLVRLLALGSGLSTAALVVASPAVAAPTFTVSAGAAAAGSSVATKSTSTSAVVFTDTTTSQSLTCTSTSVPGSIKVGSGLSGKSLGLISATKAKFVNCIGPANIAFTITGVGKWKLNAKSFSGGVASGNITGASATVAGPPGVCSFTSAGTANWSYTNATNVLSVPATPTLTVSNVSGCFGLINNGDKASFTTTLNLTATVAADNPIAITSP